MMALMARAAQIPPERRAILTVLRHSPSPVREEPVQADVGVHVPPSLWLPPLLRPRSQGQALAVHRAAP